MSGPAPPVLEVDRVTKTFGGFIAVRNVSFVLERGEMSGLIGSNGAGKSTMLNLIFGLELPDSGTILFRGLDVAQTPPFRRARLGMGLKFQVTSVFDELTVEENLLLGARPKARLGRGDAYEQLHDMLALIELVAKRRWKAGSLSHGEKQWLEVGMVLLTEPRLLLLDEPTSGMTRAESRHTGDLLRELQSRGSIEAMVIVEHDLDFIRLVSDRVTVMHRGEILAVGSIDEIQADAEVQAAYLGRLQ